MTEQTDLNKQPRKLRVLLGCTGSVATVKIPKAFNLLREKGYEVQVITTKYGKTMLLDGPAENYDKASYELAMRNNMTIYTDEDEWKDTKSYKVGRDPVLHIELRRWADVFVIAPLSANTLAKLANGLCDNLLTCVARAWDPSKPMLVAPAMNTFMWDHPFTNKHLAVLVDLGYVRVISPIIKTLACNDTGNGAMAQLEDILAEIDKSLEPASVQ